MAKNPEKNGIEWSVPLQVKNVQVQKTLQDSKFSNTKRPPPNYLYQAKLHAHMPCMTIS